MKILPIQNINYSKTQNINIGFQKMQKINKNNDSVSFTSAKSENTNVIYSDNAELLEFKNNLIKTIKNNPELKSKLLKQINSGNVADYAFEREPTLFDEYLLLIPEIYANEPDERLYKSNIILPDPSKLPDEVEIEIDGKTVTLGIDKDKSNRDILPGVFLINKTLLPVFVTKIVNENDNKKVTIEYEQTGLVYKITVLDKKSDKIINYEILKPYRP